MSHRTSMDSLSERAAKIITRADRFEPIIAALSDPWSVGNPGGVYELKKFENAETSLLTKLSRIMLGVAENTLLHEMLEEHIAQTFDIDQIDDFGYRQGPHGLPRMRTAIAKFMNQRFQPIRETHATEFVVTAGVSALIDQIAWCVCGPEESILVPQPMYSEISSGMNARARVTTVPVSFRREDGSLVLDDVFDPDANLRCFERAYRMSEQQSVKVKAVLITNPHNPLGKCYSSDTIRSIAGFCADRNLHFISDEIYALSTFRNSGCPDTEPFTSVLAVDIDHIIPQHLVHVLYGPSKDFGLNGLRLGALHSRNSDLRRAMRDIGVSAWPSHISQSIWARILEDQPFLDCFIAENRRMLARHYELVTSFLDRHGLEYYRGGNAGLFVWVDVGKILLGSNGKNPYSGASDRICQRAFMDTPAAMPFKAKKEEGFASFSP